eukprot:UN17365
MHTTGSRYVYSGSAGTSQKKGAMYIWDIYTGKEVYCLEKTKHSIYRATSWHPYRPLLLGGAWCGNDTGCVDIWNLTGKEIKTQTTTLRSNVGRGHYY